MKNKIKRKITYLWILLFLWGTPQMVYADTNAAITFTGVEMGDLVEVYAIANYAEDNNLHFQSAVSNWIRNSEEGGLYRSISTDKLLEMKPEKAQEFCELLITGLKNEAEGIANLKCYTFKVMEEQDDYKLSLEPGIYIMLPKGKNRIYDLKWFVVEAEEEHAISYLEADYSLPRMQTRLELDTDLGEYAEGIPTIKEGDALQVETSMWLPTFPDTYAVGKRVLNATVIVPQGISFEKNSLLVERILENDTREELVDEEYGIQSFEKVRLYRDGQGKPIFFQVGTEWFYEMDGNQLTAGSKEDAIGAYNMFHDTNYHLPEEGTRRYVEPEQSTEEEEGASEELQNGQEEANEPQEASTEETTEGTEEVDVPEDTEEGWDVIDPEEAENILIIEEATIFILALDTQATEYPISISYKAEKNAGTNTSGLYDLGTFLSYSTSPLDANRKGCMEATTKVASYGVQITVCLGGSVTASLTNHEIMNGSYRLGGATFSLYREVEQIEGKLEEIETTTEESLYYYDKATDSTFRYEFWKNISCNDEGQVAIGGVEPIGYLIVESTCPEGYSLSDTSLVVFKGDWIDQASMEGNGLFDILWMDYKTTYMPATGKNGIWGYMLLGTLICIGSLFYMGVRSQLGNRYRHAIMKYRQFVTHL